jgi:hypothetical protein
MASMIKVNRHACKICEAREMSERFAQKQNEPAL